MSAGCDKAAARHGIGLECLPASCQFDIPSPPPDLEFYGRVNYSDAGGGADGAGPVPGHRLAHQPAHAAGAGAGGVAGPFAIRDQRVEGDVHPEQDARAADGP